MRYLKSVTALVLLLTFAGVASAQETDRDTKAELRQAAKEYLEVQPVEKMMSDVAEKTTAQMPGERKEMTQALMDEVRYDTLRTAMIDAMTATFTVEEIEALTQFYSTPEGRSVMEKMSTYMAEVQPVIMKEV
ncbi:DUF2059 domain-containing protein [Salinibacter altiplanensis]|uniref:DUF2059 domain-containing protein n=1 Tax=Salinibacter altiplanensis TaxID=1803181 RepID=UPI000C9F0E3D|nr:DUF2059 domain-containing protein [Salinibacter altiplanensis]